MNTKTAFIIGCGLFGAIFGNLLVQHFKQDKQPENIQQTQQEPAIKKTYSTAEQNQIWEQEIRKISPQGYSIEFNFNKVDELPVNYKTARYCVDEVSRSFQEIFERLQKIKHEKQVRESLTDFIAKYQAVNDNFCTLLAQDQNYNKCFEYSQSIMDLVIASFKQNANDIDKAQQAISSTSAVCKATLTSYELLIEKNEPLINRKQVVYTGNQKAPFAFCNSFAPYGEIKHFCHLTDFQKAGLVSKFE